MNNEPLTIVELRVANVKRLRAVRIRPDPGSPIVKLTGPNDAGKSSTLDAIFYALAGERNIPAEPIRRGADKAEIRLDLGELVVTRKFTKGGSSLTVTAADGRAYPKPQQILDKLFGAFTFDPLEFSRLKPREQRDKLLALTGLAGKVADLDARKLGLEQQRTEINREVKRLDGAVASVGELPEKEPPTIDTAAILTERQGREAALRTVRATQAERQTALINAESWQRQAAQLREQIAVLNKKLADAETNEIGWRQKVRRSDDQLAGMVLPTFDDLDAKLASADAANTLARRWQEREQLRAKAVTAASDSGKLTAQIAAIEEAKGQLIATVKMPVAGLGFNENGVTFNGLPFEQICSGDQWRISTAIGMADNPRLRIMRILDGSLLDGKHWQAIEDAARGTGFQVWIEQVAQWRNDAERTKALAEPSGVIFEDGEIIASETGADGEAIGESPKAAA